MNVIISNKYQSMLATLDIDVIKSLNGVFSVDEIISQFQNFFFQRMILDITAIKDYKDITVLQKLSISLDMDKVILLLDDDPESSSNEYLSKLISMGIYNFTKTVEGIMYLYNNLSYMIKNQLSHNYSVVAIEVGKTDFRYFGDKTLISTTDSEIGTLVARNTDKEVIIIDVNDSKQAESLCQDIIYLVEPSVIKLNKLMMINHNVFANLKNKKIVLNQSLLSKKDVLDFEYESKSKVFYNMPPLDEREKDIYALNAFLVRLGFVRQQTAEETTKKNKLFGIF